VVRDLGALPPDAILYLLAQPLLDLASDHLMRDRDLTERYEERFEVEDSEEWMAAMAEYNQGMQPARDGGAARLQLRANLLRAAGTGHFFNGDQWMMPFARRWAAGAPAGGPKKCCRPRSTRRSKARRSVR